MLKRFNEFDLALISIIGFKIVLITLCFMLAHYLLLIARIEPRYSKSSGIVANHKIPARVSDPNSEINISFPPYLVADEPCFPTDVLAYHCSCFYNDISIYRITALRGIP